MARFGIDAEIFAEQVGLDYFVDYLAVLV